MQSAPGTLPKYVQTAEMLIREIASGRLADGARLPPERELARDLGLAVGTLRKALDDLVSRGLLERRQGSGNYVRNRPEAAGVYAFFRLEKPEGGGLPTAEVLSVRRLRKPATLPPFGSGDEAQRIRRLRRLDGVAIALEEIWIDAAIAPRLEARDLSEALYRFYRRRFGLWISQVEDRVGTASVPDWSLPEFGPPVGGICGHVLRRAMDGEGRVVEVSRTWFDAGRASYVSRLR